MDFDPRDYDSRDEERFDSRGGKDSSQDDPDRDDDLRLLDVRSRDRDDDNARELGRGPGDSRESNAADGSRDARNDDRWPDRDREPRDRTFDPREPFTRDLTCHADSNANSCATAITSTRCADRRRARSRPSARFEWSRVVISKTTTTVRSILVQATCGTFASKASLKRFVCPARASTRWR